MAFGVASVFTGVCMSGQPKVVEVVALQDAQLCVNCDMISDSKTEECQVCGSRSLINLANILGMVPSIRAIALPEKSKPKFRHAA